MKILMFGWEFPPHITGGLGTACYGITKALAKTGNEIVFIVPKSYGDEPEDYTRILSASEIDIDLSQEYIRQYWENISYIEVNSKLVPYLEIGRASCRERV